LRTIPLGGADTISIRFNDEVYVTSGALNLEELHGVQPPQLQDFSYDVILDCLAHTAGD
jgi:hypothetical protein